jgi:hypothetical protein
MPGALGYVWSSYWNTFGWKWNKIARNLKREIIEFKGGTLRLRKEFILCLEEFFVFAL